MQKIEISLIETQMFSYDAGEKINFMWAQTFLYAYDVRHQSRP